jgi:hypothetical protein
MRKQGKVHESVEKFTCFRAEQCIAEADNRRAGAGRPKPGPAPRKRRSPR